MDKLSSCKGSLEPGCGKLCSHDHVTHLVTRVGLIEGAILEQLERERIMALRELMEKLEWEPCAITMAVGSLIRQGMIQCAEYDQNVFLQFCESSK